MDTASMFSARIETIDNLQAIMPIAGDKRGNEVRAYRLRELREHAGLTQAQLSDLRAGTQ